MPYARPSHDHTLATADRTVPVVIWTGAPSPDQPGGVGPQRQYGHADRKNQNKETAL